MEKFPWKIVISALAFCFISYFLVFSMAGEKGDLHMHTTCSDGVNTYEEMASVAIGRGLSFIAITDHRVCADVFEKCAKEARLLCMPSEEVTTPGWHILALGISDEICIEQGENVCEGNAPAEYLIGKIHGQGGIAIAAHPMLELPEDKLAAELGMFDAMECGHPSYSLRQARKAREFSKLLDVPCVYDSDAHQMGALGGMHNICAIETVSAEAVKQAVLSGKCRRGEPFLNRISRYLSLSEYLPETGNQEESLLETKKPEEALPTCAEAGGECLEPLEGDRCSGIKFEADKEVSDCPGKCCVCCKQIIRECVPDSCCHAKGCVLKQTAPDCSGIMCSMECSEGTMDCGQGHCEFDDNAEGYCSVVWS